MTHGSRIVVFLLLLLPACAGAPTDPTLGESELAVTESIPTADYMCSARVAGRYVGKADVVAFTKKPFPLRTALRPLTSEESKAHPDLSGEHGFATEDFKQPLAKSPLEHNFYGSVSMGWVLHGTLTVGKDGKSKLKQSAGGPGLSMGVMLSFGEGQVGSAAATRREWDEVPDYAAHSIVLAVPSKTPSGNTVRDVGRLDVSCFKQKPAAADAGKKKAQ
jgi:hypothetical protein